MVKVLPITLAILTKLYLVFATPFKHSLFSAMMFPAFKMVTLYIKRFRHSGSQSPQPLQAGGEAKWSQEQLLYPASIMREFLQERGRVQASLCPLRWVACAL